jgi:hypothetical protein
MDAALAAAQTVPRETLADFLGDLERVRVTALARLIAPAPEQHQPNELLDVKAASRVLGCSVDYLYHHHDRFLFTRRVGRSLRFSAQGIAKYIQRASVRHDG